MLTIGGIELLPAWPVFLGFVVAGLALNIVPGADMTFVAASAARGGRREGVVAARGIGAGALVHILAAVLGLSAILASSEAAFAAIKWLGAVYLLWLAVSLLRSHGSEKDGPKPPASPWRLFRAAMLVNILNPKVALFFLAFLPQFVDPAAQVPALQILCLGLWFDLVGTLVNIAVALAAAGAAHRLRQVSWLGRAARWLAATAMGALAVQLALASRRHA
jgi:threonine/homoserine/homoserine lactone efflux protein